MTFAGVVTTPALARNPAEWSESRWGWAKPRVIPERSLSFRNRHTDETLNTVYYAEGRYLPDALSDVSYLMRDHRTDEVKDIDPRLLDILYDLQQRMETKSPLIVFSGYRSPATNALLRREGIGVARNSLHMQGMAIDLTMPGWSTRDIARAALAYQQGGVGYYPRSNFVHIDSGEVRTWLG